MASNFGSQFTQLIARRLRETIVYCEIHPYDVGDDFIRNFAPRGIVLSGHVDVPKGKFVLHKILLSPMCLRVFIPVVSNQPTI